MLKILVPFALAFIVQTSASAQVPRELVGKYQMDVQGGDILDLRGDGTASIGGEETRWSAKGNQLSVGPDVMPYQLQGDRLVLRMGAVLLAWKKIGGAATGQIPMQKAAAKSQAQPSASSEAEQDMQARQLLTSSAWCAFTYNKVSGTSTTRKVIFRPGGVMTVNGGAETYSFGYGGSYAGQSNTAGAMRWKLENLRLFVDQGGGGFQDVGLTATRNSNGYVILHAEGREYSMCN